ncbi:protein of unknown function [Taphrina deformans PYCC 5710]|uniref:Uncharacterized protein n=1 Tax=Taphrina deformans (strain PYCC 5710 / ATCC 11124 / CBS 356.35 / IMI 108563 / JCM 9778 / NBRC 8474) TaxID=1097556 RepID=R4XGX1_TAPDE|nr:protein of unknown function [Taphrina deformans PYCC 5710]|eukprot:CCG85133.1 protein of unknown function [Taphrina deformans PYCC 5710]
MDQRSDSSSASTSPVNTSVANLKTADCTPHAGLAMIRSNTSGLKKEKNTKKLSLSTAAAQKLGPMIQISDQLQNHPKTATPLSRRKPMKLPSLNIGLVRRPSLPLMAGKIPPPTPIDRTFSVVRELQSDGTPDLLKESSSTNAYTSGPNPQLKN